MKTPKYVVVDLETTGNSPRKGARIIQLAIVTIENDQITETYTAFINPEQKIPAFIQDLTGIRDKDVAEAPPFEAVAEEVRRRLEDAVFVAHNADFDLSFLLEELKRAGTEDWKGLVMDTVELSRLVYPSAFSYKLQDITAELGIALDQAHRADDDAYATAELFLQAKHTLYNLPMQTLSLLHKRSFGLKSDVSNLLYELTAKKRSSQQHAARGTEFRGIPLRPAEVPEAMHPHRFEALVDPLARLRQVLPEYEYRESQEHLFGTVREALNEAREVAIEASTGMGKTIAYLLPAAEYALLTGERVVISTFTTHLQDQLVQKEGQLAAEMMDFPLQVALIKGMNHYLSLSRFHELLESEDESYDETFTIMQLLIWLTRTETGDLNELNVTSGGQFVLDKVRRSHLWQLDRDEWPHDFFERAKKRAENAHITVTNHSYLLAGGLGRLDGPLIIDEAHQLIQAALLRKEKGFVYTNWKYIFGQLGTFDDQQLFHRFHKAAEAAGIAALPELLRLESVFVKIVELFDMFSAALSRCFSGSVRNHYQKKWSLLLSELDYPADQSQELLRLFNEWIDQSRNMLKRAERLTELPVRDRAIFNDWRYWTEEVAAAAVSFGEIFVFPDTEEVSWIEGDLRSLPTSLSVYRRPFDAAGPISELFGSLRGRKAVVCLSGTMSVPSDERFISRQLGLPETVPVIRFQPEKEFYTGAQVFVVEDMPDIQSVPQADYIESVADAVTQTVLMTEGRCFVLFTSQDMLRKTVELIQDSGLLDDYMLFAQGLTSGGRMRLLKSFQRFPKSVLFGTNSFWEGVDVPGDALRAVIVVRLPFTSPDEPLFKARSRKLAEQGKNAFLDHALPEAVLRLRQGFGRLIRSKQDQGLFIVLDRRIETKSYGEEFLKALPPVPVAKVSLEKMVTAIEHWYNESGRNAKDGF